MKLIKVLVFIAVLAIPVVGISAYFSNIEKDCIAQEMQDGANEEFARHLCRV